MRKNVICRSTIYVMTSSGHRLEANHDIKAARKQSNHASAQSQICISACHKLQATSCTVELSFCKLH